MPEARIRVAALHLAGARALPLLCLGLGGGLPSRLVHHARSALKQQKSSSAPRAAPANASLRLPSSQQLALRQVASKSRSTHRRRRQKRRTNPCKYSIRYRTRQKISVYGQTLATAVGIVLIITMVFWLGLNGPIDINKIKDWQTLITGVLALVAAGGAYWGATAKVRFDREVADGELKRRKLALY